MLSPVNFFRFLKNKKINFFVGVPDSLLKNFCYYVSEKVSKKNHIISANEGTALSIACGYNISTGNIPFVYLQNSGLGNIINPLISMADKSVYSIPMIIMVGWRGQPGVQDEPQHQTQGLVTLDIIKTLKKKYKVLDGNEKKDLVKTQNAIKLTRKLQEPVFLVVKKGIFKKVLAEPLNNKNLLSREKVIYMITDILKKNFKFVSTTGMISRELYEIRNFKKESKSNDFLTVGSMGHASQIALGMSLNSKKKIVCIDGDGSFLMHMGGASTIGNIKSKNFIHIVLNNFSHDSVGGQPTSANTTSLSSVAKACGYADVIGPLKSENQIKNQIEKISGSKKYPIFIEILVKRGSRKNLGRPKEKPIENKKIFFRNFNK